MELLNALKWRYATKRMTGEKLEQQLVDQIVEAARLAPTSAGVQPFHIFIISNSETKAQISPIAFNQPQIIESSHLLVFTAWDKMDDERIQSIYDYTNTERGLPLDKMKDVVDGLKSLFSTFTEEQQHHHAAKQAHIGFGMAIAAAAELRVDATPMEGFNKDELDEFLGLQSKGLKSVTLLALGRRQPEGDWLSVLKKVRRPTEEFITEIK